MYMFNYQANYAYMLNISTQRVVTLDTLNKTIPKYTSVDDVSTQPCSSENEHNRIYIRMTWSWIRISAYAQIKYPPIVMPLTLKVLTVLISLKCKMV